MVRSYTDLIVWQRAMELVVEIYDIVRKLPKEEIYALSDQMRRSAISIPSNIAEGQARNTTREFVSFLSIAKGSDAELHTQLLICDKLGYLTQEDIDTALKLTEEVGKMLVSLIQTLKANH